MRQKNPDSLKTWTSVPFTTLAMQLCGIGSRKTRAVNPVYPLVIQYFKRKGGSMGVEYSAASWSSLSRGTHGVYALSFKG